MPARAPRRSCVLRPCAVVACAALLGGCRFVPLGWWDIPSLRLGLDGGDTVEVSDAGFVQVVSDGGDSADLLLRYHLIPQLDGSVAVIPAEDPPITTGEWEMSGREDFALRVVIGESFVPLVTDQTTGEALELVTEDVVSLSVPSSWAGEGAGTGAAVSCSVELSLQR